MHRAWITTVLVLGLFHVSFATHLCAGELRYTRISGLTYRIEVRLYLNSNAPADVPEVILNYGDGNVDTIPAETDLALTGGCCDRLRTYIGENTYPGPGIYTPSIIARNRTPGVLNVPSSVDTPMCLSSMLLVTPDLTNSSPEFTNHAVFSYYNGAVLTHELQPYDADGDSLSFDLIEPAGDECGLIPGYEFPDEVVAGPYSISVDANGVVQWDAPQLAGYYAMAIRCTEWREGEMIGAVTRDMLFCVTPFFTAIPSQARPTLAVEQSSLNGPVFISTDGGDGSAIEIFDASGAVLQRLRSSGSRTTLATDGMAPGLYLMRLTSADGLVSSGRFAVVR